MNKNFFQNLVLQINEVTLLKSSFSDEDEDEIWSGVKNLRLYVEELDLVERQIVSPGRVYRIISEKIGETIVCKNEFLARSALLRSLETPNRPAYSEINLAYYYGASGEILCAAIDDISPKKSSTRVYKISSGHDGNSSWHHKQIIHFCCLRENF